MSRELSTEMSAQLFLQRAGFQVQRIPESDTPKTPHFFVSDNSHSYLLEVKEKFSDTQKLATRKETLERGEVYQHQEQLSHNRNISNIIRDAVHQLSSYGEKAADF